MRVHVFLISTLLCLLHFHRIALSDVTEENQRRLGSSLSIYDEISKPKTRPARWLGELPAAAVPQEAPAASLEQPAITTATGAAGASGGAAAGAGAAILGSAVAAPVQMSVAPTASPSSQYLSPILETYSKSATEVELENKYQDWLHSYKAPDPADQEYCMGVFMKRNHKQAHGSQFGQDLFTFFNYFKYWPMEGRKGFYVDSGANGK